MLKRVIILTFALLSACATLPQKYGDVKEGNWKAKALVKDNERSYIVNLNLNVKKDEAVRMDVTTTLGTGVASLVANNRDVRYSLYESKRFYFGTPQPGVMRPILAIPFDPRWLQNLLFDTPIPDKSWTCTQDSSGVVESCADSVSGIKITWSNRNGAKKTVQIDHSKASVQINVQSFKPKVEDRKNLFSLEAPEGFQKLRVR